MEAVSFYLLVAKKQYEDNVFSGKYNVGPEGADCITTGEMANLFCRAWGEDASWHSISYNGPHEANLLKLDTSSKDGISLEFSLECAQGSRRDFEVV